MPLDPPLERGPVARTQRRPALRHPQRLAQRDGADVRGARHLGLDDPVAGQEIAPRRGLDDGIHDLIDQPARLERWKTRGPRRGAARPVASMIRKLLDIGARPAKRIRSCGPLARRRQPAQGQVSRAGSAAPAGERRTTARPERTFAGAAGKGRHRRGLRPRRRLRDGPCRAVPAGRSPSGIERAAASDARLAGFVAATGHGTEAEDIG
jgi:hypothetical protein